MPSASLAPDSAPKRSFGSRCAQRAIELGIIDEHRAADMAHVIDQERAAVIARAAEAKQPISEPAPVKTTIDGNPIVDGKKFGDRKKIPPTPEQVAAYGAAIGYPLDGQDFCDSYEAKGWKVGKNRMKDWQATVRNWRTNGWGKLLAPPSNSEQPKRREKF